MCGQIRAWLELYLKNIMKQYTQVLITYKNFTTYLCDSGRFLVISSNFTNMTGAWDVRFHQRERKKYTSDLGRYLINQNRILESPLWCRTVAIWMSVYSLANLSNKRIFLQPTLKLRVKKKIHRGTSYSKCQN